MQHVMEEETHCHFFTFLSRGIMIDYSLKHNQIKYNLNIWEK